MFRTSIALLVAALSLPSSTPFAQGTAAPASQAAVRTPPAVPPLFFREDWSGKRAPRDCTNLHDARCEVALTQEFVATPNLELQMYGGGKRRLEHGEWLGAVGRRRGVRYGSRRACGDQLGRGLASLSVSRQTGGSDPGRADRPTAGCRETAATR